MTSVEIYDPSSRIYHMRKAGSSIVEIADELEITTAEAVSLFRAYQKQLMASYGPDERDQMIQLELSRLDDLQRVAWNQAMAGDLKALEAVLKVMTHRMKLLGLDQLTPTDEKTLAKILIVGGDREAFIDAVRAGRESIVGGVVQDDEDDSKEG